MAKKKDFSVPSIKPRPIKVSKESEEKPKKNLSPHEQETIIVYNKADKEASLFTYQKALINHMKKLGAEIEWVNSHGGTEFKFPKSWIRKPLTPRKERDKNK